MVTILTHPKGHFCEVLLQLIKKDNFLEKKKFPVEFYSKIFRPLKIYPKQPQCKISNLYAQLDTQIYHQTKPQDQWTYGF
jgi:hypothetical protein